MSWFKRLKQGLSKTSGRLTQSISGVLTRRKLDDEALEGLEDALIAADLGVAVAGQLIQRLAKDRFAKQVTDEEVRSALAEHMAEILEPVTEPLVIDPARKPHVVLVVGVNGSGKTTTIGKLGQHYSREGLKLRLAAGDTFRAAAIEQLQIWGKRCGTPVVAKESGADAAGLAFDALAQAKAAGDDLLLIDTAGRLHNKTELMDELAKIQRVLKKQDPDAPHDILLVLDATTGQNAIPQVQIFKDLVSVTGLVVTKLDGSAKGGILIALAERFGLPIHAIGVGEGAEDLKPFDAKSFSRSLMDLGTASP
ncbi:MAG: signal recognition particle-docking protein FtsY [Rhodospirillales bacterium]|nr:signal recognition particle-docking protein FtsY [Rhodospirillales bacterium]